MECKRDSSNGSLGGASETHWECVSHCLNLIKCFENVYYILKIRVGAIASDVYLDNSIQFMINSRYQNTTDELAKYEPINDSSTNISKLNMQFFNLLGYAYLQKYRDEGKYMLLTIWYHNGSYMK